MSRDNALQALQTALPEGIVDAHHHFWDLGQGHYPWLQDAYDETTFFLGRYEALRRNYGPDDLERDTAPLRICATVHIEAERDRADQLGETRWLESVRAVSGLPTVLVGHVSFLQSDLDAVLHAQAASPLMRGIRSKPVTAGRAGEPPAGRSGTLQDPEWIRGLSRLQDFGLSWDLRVPFWHLGEAAEVAASLPDLPIAINHCGLPIDRSPEALAVWRRGLENLAGSPKVVLKLSELGLKGGVWDPIGNAAIVRECVAIFGVERVMYGSNLPVGSLSASAPAIMQAVLAGLPDLDTATLRAVFADNAGKFYRF